MENNPIKKPEIVVFAGPNGSGKSTITDLLRPPMLPYVNADEIQRVLDCDNMEAAKIAEKRREDYLDKHKGFCFETVLSTDRNLKLLKRAKDADFFVRCYYVLTADPQINVARVASRVSAGGNSGRHTGNIDLRVGCQDIITADEKVGIFCSLEEF